MIEMQTELKTLRQKSKDLEIERDAADTRYNDLADQVELATLDKEVRRHGRSSLDALRLPRRSTMRSRRLPKPCASGSPSSRSLHQLPSIEDRLQTRKEQLAIV